MNLPDSRYFLISKRSSECSIQIGHKKMLLLIHDGYVSLYLSGLFIKVVRAKETFIFYFPTRNEETTDDPGNISDAISRTIPTRTQKTLFLTDHRCRKRHRYDDIIMGFYGKAFDNDLQAKAVGSKPILLPANQNLGRSARYRS